MAVALVAAPMLSFALSLSSQPTAAALSNTIVISQVYGGGGNSQATYTNDFIELFNRGTTPVDVTGWSVQYASATGSSWQKTDLAGTIQPGGYYLVQESAGTGGTTPLPTPDASGPILMSATAGKVALLNTNITLTAGITNPIISSANLIDFVGFGTTANAFEGTGPTPAPSNTTAVLRGTSGCVETDSNSADFAAGPPVPRNSASPVNLCGTPQPTPTTDPNATPTLTPVPPTATNTPIVVPTTPPGTCGDAYTATYTVQGSGNFSPISGTVVSVQGVVVGDYEGAAPALSGFYIQDPAGDGNPATSDGLFVFNGSNNSVTAGQVVRVTGRVSEFRDQTQLDQVSSILICGTATATPAEVTLPLNSISDLEQYEGMLVKFSQQLFVTEHFQLGRFGQVVLSSGGRLKQPTNIAAPGAPSLAVQADNNRNRILLDDTSLLQNPDPIIYGDNGQPLSAANTLRGGDSVVNLTGVLGYNIACQSGVSGCPAIGTTNVLTYRLRPADTLPQFQITNPRPATPSDVGGRLKIASANLLNFFNTYSGCTLGVGGGTTDCRGAGNATEFSRQLNKTVSALIGHSADVIGFMEMENDGYDASSAVQVLVDNLNAIAGAGTYAFINPDLTLGVNALGVDAIKVGIIYKPGRVSVAGNVAVLNTGAFGQIPITGGPMPTQQRNRPALAVSFRENDTNEIFTVVVNHLKSKGSSCDDQQAPYGPDVDTGDGQGNCNQTRLAAANQLVAWINTNPTGVSDPDVLIMGDLNAYAQEDPITAIKNAGYVNLIEQRIGADAYSYAFDGQWGYIDHALASSSLSGQVTGITEWHISADEPSVLDYNTDFKSAGQITSLYAPDQYRSSDHDPIVLGLNLSSPSTPVPPSPTPSDTPTNTPVPPSPTPTDTATNTPVPPTATPTDTPTNTPVVPTTAPSSTATNTPVPPTDTPTNTPVPPTATPTDTPTNTPVPPSATPTDTPTNTPVPPTATPTDTPTNTPVPPTATPTNTPTNTPVPPSATPTTCAPVNLVPGGNTYRWWGMTSATADTNRTTEARLKDGNIAVDVNLRGSGDDLANRWEAAGVIWSAPQTIGTMSFYNGAADSPNNTIANGEFSANVKMQYTADGVNWIDSGWTISPAYVGNNISSTSKWYVFTGSAINARGVRVVGQVRTSSQFSWHANVNELQASVNCGGSAPTATPVVTNTPVPPSATPTNTPTSTPTNTPVGPTSTPLPNGNQAPSGTAYRWFGNSAAASNANRTADARLNDTNLAVNVNLRGTGDDVANAWEAAGVVWSNTRTVNSVKFWNGACDSTNLVVANGFFMANLRAQYTTDGVTWVNATGWTVSPAYPYVSLSSCNAYYTFSGPTLSNVRGVRITGQVRTSNSYSWHAVVNEVEAY